MTPTAAHTMARYNRWMNEKLLTACAELPDEERKLDRGAPFKSIHGLWNHILLANRIWLGRFNGEPFVVKSLGDELYADFGELRAAFAETDEAVLFFANSLTEKRLAGTLEFVSIVKPQPHTLPMWIAVMHFFNHGTHHRGQITALMEQAGADCGVTDLLVLPAE